MNCSNALGALWIHSPLKKYRKQFVYFTINVFTPFLIFISLIRIDLDSNWIFPVVAALLVTIIGLIVPIYLARIHKQEKPEPAEICTASFSNALNFPYPVIFAFSPDSIGIAGIFLAIAIVLRNTVGLWVSGIELNKRTIKEIFSFPPIWGIIVGILLRFSTDIGNSRAVNSNSIDLIFQIGIFATLMTIGFALKKPNWDYKHSLYRVGVSRFIVSAIVAFLLVILFSLPKLIAIPIIVQMMAPPAVYNGLYAEKFGLNTELTSQVIVGLTFIALLILPLELLIIQLMF